MSISKEKGQYYQEKWEELQYEFANIEMKEEIEKLQQENKQLKDKIKELTQVLLDIKEYIKEKRKSGEIFYINDVEKMINKALGDSNE